MWRPFYFVLIISYTLCMSDSPAFVDHVPENLRDDVLRLLAISPQFSSLMRTANEQECRALFVALDAAVLPDASELWLPACDSDVLGECMAHLRRCKQRGLRHFIWWEMGLYGDIEESSQRIADFASGLLQQALEMAERLIKPRYGRLPDSSFCIIGLGKLGGRELNLGSDVDPLFI